MIEDQSEIKFVYEPADNYEGLIAYEIPVLTELTEEENKILHDKICDMYETDDYYIKRMELENNEIIVRKDKDDLLEYLLDLEQISEGEFDFSQDNPGFWMELIESKLTLSEDSINELNFDNDVYINRETNEVFSHEEAVNNIDLDYYEYPDAPFRMFKINNKFIYQEKDEYGDIQYNIITGNSIMEHLQNFQSIEFINSYDEMNSGSHKIFFNEKEGLWKCYGKGMNWHDISDDFNLQTVKEITEYLLKQLQVKLL